METDKKGINWVQQYDNAEGVFIQAHPIIWVRRDPYSYLMWVVLVAWSWRS